MIIGIPREIKKDEYRVGLLPVGAQLLVEDGHSVLLEKGAGLGSGFGDSEYEAAGAVLVDLADKVYSESDLVMKVKEPQPEEISMLRKDRILFCYFHFAGSRELTEGCIESGISAVAFETLTDGQGRLPLLTPMPLSDIPYGPISLSARLEEQAVMRCATPPCRTAAIWPGSGSTDS